MCGCYKRPSHAWCFVGGGHLIISIITVIANIKKLDRETPVSQDTGPIAASLLAPEPYVPKLFFHWVKPN